MPETPFFSIITATYGRGRHIAPTIQSVLRQSFEDFELIVVGDGRNDETESIVRSFSDKRVIWHNLPQNTGSQSFPNNEGIGLSRGGWIAYMGHDDIWTSDHLSRIHAASDRDKDADFVISGCVFHTPPGTGIYHVHGLFEDADTAFKYFFPPSSIAHRRDVTERIGLWRDPHSIVRAIDHDLMWRATEAGLKFTSTGVITTHKFAAGHRYLSYLQVTSDEQQDMLEALANGTAPDPAQIVATAKRNSTFMIPMPTNFEEYKPGFLFERNRQNKGISRPQLSPLRKRTVIKQTGEGRALDWQNFKRRWPKKFRWSGPNPKPKILIPYTGQQARITLEALNTNTSDLSLYVEDRHIPFRVRRSWVGTSLIVAEIPLKADDYTVLTLEKPTVPLATFDKRKDNRPVGIAIANIVLDPVF
jgi:glycosyltransferase involved in cell wall biosynthesis